jgi:hypothetical protein
MRYLYCFFSIVIISLTSCGTITSTGTRFHSNIGIEGNKMGYTVKRDTINLTEDFDITEFKSKIVISELILSTPKNVSNKLNIWYGYDTVQLNSGLGKLIKHEPGYRVLVLTTDNLDEANELRSEIYFKTDQKPVYVSFDPPFYKVKAGDFVNSKEANEFSFKLNQMGYAECKIIRDTVNIYQ